MSTTASAPAALRNTIAVWFEIPAEKYDRAIAFYETVLGCKLNRVQHGEHAMAVFPYERPGISGAIVPWEDKCGAGGPVIYLNADGILDEALARVVAAGGLIDIGRTAIGDGMGWFARIVDSEGNHIGLHTIV
jgi:predicted enzyme related to lactoylglutathione lyase